jgi:hypothetical protein
MLLFDSVGCKRRITARVSSNSGSETASVRMQVRSDCRLVQRGTNPSFLFTEPATGHASNRRPALRRCVNGFDKDAPDRSQRQQLTIWGHDLGQLRRACSFFQDSVHFN